jgi:peptide-methionine (S)-S-oxide reductase
MPGIRAITVGYAGGLSTRPSYEQVCAGNSGHIEVARIEYDPAQASLDGILDLFWKIHDPTSLDRQGADAGYQYHSVIYYTSEAQLVLAQAAIKAIQPHYARPIVTEVLPAPVFWPAEEYHQEYFRKNPDAGYCQAVIAPKLKKAGLVI